jgi:flagellar biosynthesis protein
MPEPRPERAVALRYSGTGAPKITAAGRGLVAERILATAEEHGVPVRRDPALLQALSTLELGREIPEELYAAVAEVLAWAYALDGEAAGRPPG